MSLRDQVYQEFRPNYLNGTWISDDEFIYHTAEWDAVKVMNVRYAH